MLEIYGMTGIPNMGLLPQPLLMLGGGGEEEVHVFDYVDDMTVGHTHVSG